MIYNKLCYITCIYLVVFSTAMAGQYVPPPSGPYKSSALVIDDSSQPGRSGQVYKFPSDSLIQQTRPVKPVFLSNRERNIGNNDFNSEPAMAVIAPVRPPVVNQSQEPQSLEQSRSLIPSQSQRQSQNELPLGQYYSNPWAVDTLSQPDDAYQGYWNNQQQYTYPQQNQYGYTKQPSQYGQYGNPNQNNLMNSPFNGMPSPWSAMPMQPFFSGK